MFGSSHVGVVRSENQDSYMLDTLENGIGFAVVCDGMGGVNGGKIASLTAVNNFSECIAGLAPAMSGDELERVFDKAVGTANIRIYQKSLDDNRLYGMGTTLVAAIVVGDKAYILNIGDSRCYLLHDGEIQLVTKDHSAVQELVDRGMLTAAQARNHPNKNIITRALGVTDDVEYDLFVLDIKQNDTLLLCSDGITNYVDDLELPFEMLKHADQEIPQRLIELANSRGGADNSTVVIIKV